ncbi:UNVERIFIED_CONTAM: Dynein heavy chain 6, axonemal [Siphonaria sp. JEL0065]|nr:Dynein heavy chain 6, axonemal [Siphonaria sp. JEL0065]
MKFVEEHMHQYVSDWDEIMDCNDPYSANIPGEHLAGFTDFQKLLLIKIIREEKLVSSIIQFVSRNLGQEFIDIPPLDLVKVYKDTTSKLPMIFILSSGSDPIAGLMKMAASKEFNMQDRLHMISLGQGQGPIAEELIRRATSAEKFGPLGWNICYDWSNSDLEVSITILKNILQENKQIPWDALLYLTGEITFGGRVTDDWDRRTVRSILAKYYTPHIMDDAYAFSSSGIYFAPKDGDLASFKNYIDSMPFTEDPSVFGMHENANISYQLQESRRLIRTVLDVQPRMASGGSGKTSEEIVTDVATAILEGAPELLYIDLYAIENSEGASIATDLFAKGSDGRMINSLSTVLMQESNRFNKLLKVVKSSLGYLIKAVKGLVVMSSELELVFQSLLNNEVPKSWATVAYPSLKPLAAWVKDLHLRIEELSLWIDNGQPPCFWLPGFFFPQGFLTGVLQNMARKYNIPIDSLMFAYKVSPYEDGDEGIKSDVSALAAKKKKPNSASSEKGNQEGTSGMAPSSNGQLYPDEDGVLIRGLYVEGARWDRERRVLQDSNPMEMFSPMPLMRFIPTQVPQREGGIYVCPLYKTSARAGTLTTTGQSSNFIVPVNIPTDKPQDYWISKGVALLCQLNE